MPRCSTVAIPTTPSPSADVSEPIADCFFPRAPLLLPVPCLQRTDSGPLCIPAAERVPCDLLAWGSAQRTPPMAPSLRSVLGVAEDCWQHRAAPAPAPGAASIDAYIAAVGRKHAAVVTASGALYAWGEGRGGKLGLGHDLDQAQPQRLRHGLEGQCVVAVAAGDDCTAALTDAGDLFMWGRLHADARPQLVPLQVRGDLRGRKVVQVGEGAWAQPHAACLLRLGQQHTISCMQMHAVVAAHVPVAATGCACATTND